MATRIEPVGDLTTLLTQDHRHMSELRAGLDVIRASPADRGRIEMIVRRPRVARREELDSAELDVREGLVGDGWWNRGNRWTPDGSADVNEQITLMNSRVIHLVAGSRDRWALAGDQFFVDLDLSRANLPPGTRLALGSAVIEATHKPHTGCVKFANHFGQDALRFTAIAHRQLRLRGINARVIESGTVRAGDLIHKLP